MDNRKKLILISGKKRSGKSSCGGLIKQQDPSIKLYAFAGPLKQLLAETLGIPMAVLEEWKNDGYVCMHGLPPGDVDEGDYLMQTYRDMLQRLGTEAAKPIFGIDVWSSLAVQNIKKLFQHTDTVVITDWRFEEEYWYVREAFSESKSVAHGTAEILTIDLETWRIERPNLLSDDQHISETALDDFEFDKVIINDGTLENLKANCLGHLGATPGS